MNSTFMTGIEIKHVRHLRDITIPLSETERKHLILTGKNGSGKTSVLDELVEKIEYFVSNQYTSEDTINRQISWRFNQLVTEASNESEKAQRNETEKQLGYWKNQHQHYQDGVVPQFSSLADMQKQFNEGKYIIAYYEDHRYVQLESYTSIEKVQLSEKYTVKEVPGKKLAKYLVNLKATQAFANQESEQEKSSEINRWFDRFEGILRSIFEDETLKLCFDTTTFQFSIHQKNREPFALDQMSAGYAAVFDIINDLIMRMESQHTYDLEGVVMIDEIETHLHLELQKKILPILTGLFPNLQFVVSTHSPFILNSLDNAVVYDLERHQLVTESMTNLPYEGIVEGYFGADRKSDELKEKLEQYRQLVHKPELTDADYEQISILEMYLDEIPDYLAFDTAANYAQLKAELDARED